MQRLALSGFAGLLLLGFSSSAIAQDAVPACSPSSAAVSSIPNVDMAKVRKAWITLYNRVRRAQKLEPYSYDERLNATASEWSNEAAQTGNITHKRAADSAYYDYKQIEQWFTDQGLAFKNVNQKTFTENIGWGVYQCDATDCTSKLVSSIRSTFRFFLSEKAKKGPHYMSMTSDKYKTIGLGVAVNPDTHKYFLTVHYATEVVADANTLCANR